MLECLLKIFVCVFAVFGLYAFTHAFGNLCFPNDSIKCMILVDSEAMAENISLCLDEAKNVISLSGKKEVCIIIMEKYATNDLLRFVERKKLPFWIVSDNG